MNIIQQYEADEIARLTAGRAVPKFDAGDTLRVMLNIKEGERARVQAFEGVCIARSNKGLNSNFTVRKISYGEGVERVFALYAPTIAEIVVVRRGDVRRAKLYYLRGRRGKSARIAERARDTEPTARGRRMMAAAPRTLFDKIWDAHVVERLPDGTAILYVDRHLVHEVTSPQAFEGLRTSGRRVRRPDATIAVPDHNVPTSDRSGGSAAIAEPESRVQVQTLEENVAAFGVPFFPMNDRRQGIVHIIGPEQGISLPGMTIVCGDSHTSTHGALGALAFGIGTSEVEHVLATQTLLQKPARNMRVEVRGALGAGVTAKDMVLAIIGRIGTAGGNGHVIEYTGDAVCALDMAGRMTVCNMSIEAGARAGLIAPDDVTFNWLRGRPHAPHGEAFDHAVAYWRTLPSEPGAVYDRTETLDGAAIAPMVTWGTSPEAVAPIDATVPDPAQCADEAQRSQMSRMLDYMGLAPGQRLDQVAVDVVFIGSCTNGRLEDLRAAAAVARGRHVAPGVRALVVPGSGMVKFEAEQEGLDRVFREAGFEWREPGCSMCLGMNPDKLTPGQRCASTSNRNFEGRQGPGGRTHLLSPAMAAAAAVTGRLTDVRALA